VTVRRTAAVAFAASALALIPAAQAGARPAAPNLGTFDQQLLGYVNAARTAHGLSALTVSSHLTTISAEWAQENADAQHSRNNPRLRAELDAACPSWKLAGENVGVAGESTAHDLFRVYMNNSGERQEILNPKFTVIGVESVSGNEGPENDSAPAFWNVMDFSNHCS
jgi:uncharacterized protein YkwD